MHGRCWSQRAFAFLQLEHARTTRLLPPAALSSPPEPALLPLSSPLVRGASVVGSADGESLADSEGEEEAVSEGEDCGDDARLDASVLPSGGEGEAWRAAVGDEEDDDEADETKDDEDEADGDATVEVLRDEGRSTGMC